MYVLNIRIRRNVGILPYYACSNADQFFLANFDCIIIKHFVLELQFLYDN